MSVPDLGIISDGNANEETRSNESGDTVLLSDGENENSGGYADGVRRRRSRREFVPDPQAENFLGCNRVVTGLERAHFGVDNITPGRPCTAYFTAGYFIDSKSLFDKLQEVGIPRKSVVCMQRRPGRDMLVTFINEEIKNKFVSSAAFRYCSQSSAINAVDSPLTYLNIYDAPHELSDKALTLTRSPILLTSRILIFVLFRKPRFCMIMLFDLYLLDGEALVFGPRPLAGREVWPFCSLIVLRVKLSNGKKILKTEL